MSAIMLAWDLGSFLTNLKSNVQTWLGTIVVLVGLIMVGVAVYQIAKGLISHGRSQTNWFTVILLFLLGGAFFAGGLTWVISIAEGGKATIDGMGGAGVPTEAVRLLFR